MKIHSTPGPAATQWTHCALRSCLSLYCPGSETKVTPFTPSGVDLSSAPALWSDGLSEHLHAFRRGGGLSGKAEPTFPASSHPCALASHSSDLGSKHLVGPCPRMQCSVWMAGPLGLDGVPAMAGPGVIHSDLREAPPRETGVEPVQQKSRPCPAARQPPTGDHSCLL